MDVTITLQGQRSNATRSALTQAWITANVGNAPRGTKSTLSIALWD